MATKKSATKSTVKKVATKKAPDKRKAKLVVDVPVVTVKPTFESLSDKEHSISPDLAEQIAESRQSHEDERPPNAKLDVPEIIIRAWADVKGANDPPLDQCVPSHVDKFYTHGQRILAGSSPLSGDTMLARFERKVAELMQQLKEQAHGRK